MSGGRDDDEDEAARALRDALPDVKPMRDRSPRVRAKGPVHPPSHASSPEPPDEQADTYAGPGVSRRDVRKLARGEFRIEARLDLHGMTAAEAGTALRHFLQRARHAGHHHVCVITGVGRHSPAGAVLRPKVSAWLRATPQVLAFTPAPPSAGGAGAFYVRLLK